MCNSDLCGGCYEIEPGKWIHPPKMTDAFIKWRESFKGRAANEEIEAHVTRENEKLDEQSDLF
jgi:hypothetical protein